MTSETVHPKIFSHKIQVLEAHIDTNKHVNNLVYLQWCLDVAETHWNTNTTQTLQKDFIWYVLTHFITYKTGAFKDDELVVETWVNNVEGVKCERHYKITRTSDKKTIAEAKTLGCLLDGKTLKPTKITEKITALF